MLQQGDGVQSTDTQYCLQTGGVMGASQQNISDLKGEVWINASWDPEAAEYCGPKHVVSPGSDSPVTSGKFFDCSMLQVPPLES